MKINEGGITAELDTRYGSEDTVIFTNSSGLTIRVPMSLIDAIHMIA